jgi:hypothetical protein
MCLVRCLLCLRLHTVLLLQMEVSFRLSARQGCPRRSSAVLKFVWWQKQLICDAGQVVLEGALAASRQRLVLCLPCRAQMQMLTLLQMSAYAVEQSCKLNNEI